MRVTIKTRHYGELSFFAPDVGGYVRLESASRCGTLATQICEGGYLIGNTLTCGPTEESLASVARRWQRARARRHIREYGNACGLL